MRTLALLAALALPFSAQAAEPKTNAVKQGYQMGFKDCVEPADAAVRFVHEDDQTYAHMGIWSKRAPNDEVFNSLTSERYTDGQGLTSFTAVKTASGKCNVVFTQVLTVPDQPCDGLKKKDFAEWKFYADLNGVPVYEDPTSSDVNVVLVPTGKASCLIVKQAVLYGP